jgi:predicted nucleic acid-binding protein
VRCFFTDASALAKRYAPEHGSLLLDHLFASLPLNRLYILNVGMAEVVSLLVRKKNAGHLSSSAFAQAMLNFTAEILSSTSIQKIEVTNALVTSAVSFIESHSINATDAIILRSALDHTGNLRSAGDDLVLMASDQRLLRAAQAEGLTTFNSETQSQADLDALL